MCGTSSESRPFLLDRRSEEERPAGDQHEDDPGLFAHTPFVQRFSGEQVREFPVAAVVLAERHEAELWLDDQPSVARALPDGADRASPVVGMIDERDLLEGAGLLQVPLHVAALVAQLLHPGQQALQVALVVVAQLAGTGESRVARHATLDARQARQPEVHAPHPAQVGGVLLDVAQQEPRRHDVGEPLGLIALPLEDLVGVRESPTLVGLAPAERRRPPDSDGDEGDDRRRERPIAFDPLAQLRDRADAVSEDDPVLQERSQVLGQRGHARVASLRSTLHRPLADRSQLGGSARGDLG